MLSVCIVIWALASLYESPVLATVTITDAHPVTCWLVECRDTQSVETSWTYTTPNCKQFCEPAATRFAAGPGGQLPYDWGFGRGCDPPCITSNSVACYASGLSARYDSTWTISGTVGVAALPAAGGVYDPGDRIDSVYGYDESDPRHRGQTNVAQTNLYDDSREGQFGGSATFIYKHPTTGGTLFIGSRHIAELDVSYMTCLNIKALLILDAPVVYKWFADVEPDWTMYPQTGDIAASAKPRGQMPALSYMKLPEDGFMHFWTNIETFIDTKLAAGENVLIYDGMIGCDRKAREDEDMCTMASKPAYASDKDGPYDGIASCGPECTGCAAAAAVAIGYLYKKAGLAIATGYNQLYAARPCIEAAKWRTEQTWPFYTYYTMLRARLPGLGFDAINKCVDFSDGCGSPGLGGLGVR